MNANRLDIIDSNDPRAVLRAWVGAWDMGGWPTGDREAFRSAVEAELVYACGGGEGLDLSAIEIVEA
jgi:hypothetical protein